MSFDPLEEETQANKEPDLAERLRRRRRLALALAEGTGLRDELLREGASQILRPQLTRRLGHELDLAEKAALAEKLKKLGADRISDALLDLAPRDLAAWLTDPNAT